MQKRNRVLATLLAAGLLAMAGVPQAFAVSTTTTQIQLETDKAEAVVNGTAVPLDATPKIIGGLAYVPLKAVGALFDVKVEWNDKTSRVEMTLPKVGVQFDLQNKQIIINNVQSAFDTVAAMDSDGRLMVKLSWFADFIGAKQEYDPVTKQIKLVYVKQPDGLNNGDDTNAPVAKFTFGKSSYRLGEKIKYVDLSYSPDATGLVKYEWKGKQEAFFVPGRYPISLKVTDPKGHVSKEYTRYITIENSQYLSEFDYKVYNAEVGSQISLKDKDGKVDWSLVWGKFWDLPRVPTKVTEDRSRTLLLSDSPETITEKGILYRDKVNGKARLYADHVNGMAENVQFLIMARNTTGKTVTVKTTNKGEVYPSIYANLIGHEASVDFMLHDPVDKVPLVIPSGQSYVYTMMPDFYPGQGVNLFYDVETDGEVEFSFVAMSKVATPSDAALSLLKPLDYNGHVRGTFPVSEKSWNIDLSNLKRPSRVTVGDGKSDPFDKGYDSQRKQQVENGGNYGMMYHIHADKPGKMAVLLFATGGPFKGPFKINGDFVMAPASGVISAFETAQVLARTNGDEDSLDIEFTPPAGSAFPIDIIFYPLENLK